MRTAKSWTTRDTVEDFTLTDFEFTNVYPIENHFESVLALLCVSFLIYHVLTFMILSNNKNGKGSFND